MWADGGDDGAVARAAGRRGRAGAADPAVLPAARAADRGDAARAGRGLAAARGDDVPAPRRARARDGVHAFGGCAYASFEAALRERHGDVLFSDDGATIDEVVVAAARRPDAGDRGVVHRRADGGPADRPRRLLGVRARRARRLLERGQDGAGGRVPRADRGARRRLARGGGRAGRGRAFALRRRHRHRDHGHRRAGRRNAGEARRHRVPLHRVVRRRRRSEPCGSRARAATSATAPPPSRSTCSGPCCSVPRSGSDPRQGAEGRPGGSRSGSDPLAPLRRARPPGRGARRARLARSPTPTSGARSSPRRSTSRSPSSAPARRPTSS